MYYVEFTKAYGHFLYIYPPDAKTVFKDLGWAWTLRYDEATRFETEEKAEAEAKRLKVPDYRVRKIRTYTA